jgi:uncharacterized protein (TIGR01244 family)
MNTRTALLAITATLIATAVHAQAPQVTKPTVPGVTNFVKLESTIACGGATTPEGVAELKKLGYASIINLREASEKGAEVEAEAAAAKQAEVKYVHLPLNGSAPNPAVADSFLKAVVDPANQPVFVHCGSGNRAAALWMIKRMVVDGWDAERASTEAAALGLRSEALKKFAIDYAASRKK